MIKEINASRNAFGLNSLSLDLELNRSASIRAKEIDILFDHTRHNGTQFFTVINTRRIGSENIAHAYPDGIPTHEGFLNSPGHKRNLLETYCKNVGVGTYELPDDLTCWSVLFGNDYSENHNIDYEKKFFKY